MSIDDTARATKPGRRTQGGREQGGREQGGREQGKDGGAGKKRTARGGGGDKVDAGREVSGPAGAEPVSGSAGSVNVISGTRVHQLRAGYSEHIGLPTATAPVVVLQTQTEVDQRAAALRAKLDAVGITDISAQGVLILEGRVDLTEGLRTGVNRHGPVIATGQTLDMDAQVAEYLGPLVRRSRRTSSVALQAPVPRQVRASRALRTVANPGLDVGEMIIAVNELQLQDGTELRILPEVRHLTILAVNMTVGTGCTVVWDPEEKTQPGRGAHGTDGASHSRFTVSAASEYYGGDGGDGTDGVPGHNGFTGDFAPTVEIWALEANRLPDFLLGGGQGGPGGIGGDGGDGGDGAKGTESELRGLNCSVQPGYGGNGGDGGNAGQGGDGGHGGKGGDVLLFLSDATHESVLAGGFSLDITGGAGGEGGPTTSDGGAQPGERGLGGEAGHAKKPWCKDLPERAGSPGEPGLVAKPGARGDAGDLGLLTAAVITEAEFRDKWLAPRIATITPGSVVVGDSVTIRGAQFTADMTVTFAGVSASTTFVADTILQAVVPAVATGWVEVLVGRAGDTPSNPGSIEVLPGLGAISPSPARLGQSIKITGSGFTTGSRVLFRGVDLEPDEVGFDGRELQVTLPAPAGPFEDWGGDVEIAVRDAEGVTSAPVVLPLRHVLDSGFVGSRNAWAFLNQPQGGFADLGTFEETYGAFEVATQFLLQPTLTGAWFLFYLEYFNQPNPPGLSSGFSMTAADEYWSGNPDLYGDHSAMSQVERLLTVAQGHVLSQEILLELAAQAAQGTARVETSIVEIEQTLRAMIPMTDEGRRWNAPVSQIMPAGTVLTDGYIDKLGSSHGVLPIRVEYPMAGETWARRLVLYDNATSAVSGDESVLTMTQRKNGPTFVYEHLDSEGNHDSTSPYSSADGWTLSHLSLGDLWLTDVTMPHNFVVLFSPATLVAQDSAGRRFGRVGDQAWDDLPGAVPAVGAPGLWLLPLEQDLDLSLHGTGTGTYTVAVVAGSLGRSVTFRDVKVDPGTVDRLELRGELGQVRFVTSEAKKEVSVLVGVTDGTEFRSVAMDGLVTGGDSALTVTSTADLGEVTVEGPTGSIDARMTRARAAGVAEQDRQLVPGTPAAVEWQRIGEVDRH